MSALKSLQQRWQQLGRWQRRLLEWLLWGLLLLLALSWNNRHLLSSGVPAPDVRLHNLHGQPSHLDWQARPRTLVYFFAPWCSICRVSMPGLQGLADDHLQVVAIALDWDNTTEVSTMVAATGYDGPVLLGTPQTGQQWHIRGYPSYYVVDDQGRILHQDSGLSTPPGLWLRTR